VAYDGSAALHEVARSRPDLIVLDWLMPGRSGVEVAELLQQANRPPILMLTARDALDDRVEGLSRGADDYLVKPFAPPELIARVRALLRRTPPVDRPLQYADLSLDLLGYQARRGERRFDLTPTEFALLAHLLRHPGQALTRAQLIAAVWGDAFDGNGAILDVYIGHMRTKTEANGEPRLIQTVRGVGFALREA
jgi:two-component system response regulator MprA